MAIHCLSAWFLCQVFPSLETRRSICQDLRPRSPSSLTTLYNELLLKFHSCADHLWPEARQSVATCVLTFLHSRVAPRHRYGFGRPDYTLQPGPDHIVVAVGAVGSGYGGTLQTTTTDHGADVWQVLDNPQRSYSESSFTNLAFTSMYYTVATSAVGAFKGSMVSRDMKTGKKRWEWSVSSLNGVAMVNGGVLFFAAAGGEEQFAPLVVWKSRSGNFTVTMIDDATGESVWDFTTQWEKCRWPLSVLTINKDPSSVVSTKIVFTCQGSSSPVRCPVPPPPPPPPPPPFVYSDASVTRCYFLLPLVANKRMLPANTTLAVHLVYHVLCHTGASFSLHVRHTLSLSLSLSLSHTHTHTR
jgi:hypothetical protein